MIPDLRLVDELVERVELWLCVTVDVVPPVADEVLLVEEGSVGAEEAVPWEKELIMR